MKIVANVKATDLSEAEIKSLEKVIRLNPKAEDDVTGSMDYKKNNEKAKDKMILDYELPEDIKKSMNKLMGYAGVLRANCNGDYEKYIVLERQIDFFVTRLKNQYIGCTCKRCNCAITEKQLYENYGLCDDCYYASYSPAERFLREHG